MIYKIEYKLSNGGLEDAINMLYPKTVQYKTSDSETILDGISKVDADWNLTFQSKNSFFGVECSQFTHIEYYGKNGLRFTSNKTGNELILMFGSDDYSDTVISRLKEFGYIG